MGGPTVSARKSSGHELGGDGAVKQHQKPVAHFKELIEILGNHQHGGAAVARVAQQRPHRNRAAGVETARRIERDDQFGLMRQFAGQD